MLGRLARHQSLVQVEEQGGVTRLAGLDLSPPTGELTPDVVPVAGQVRQAVRLEVEGVQSDLGVDQ